MEARCHLLAEQSQRRLAVGTVVEIAEDLIEGAVFLHDVDDVLDLGSQEAHDFSVRFGRPDLVTVVGCDHGCQIPERLAARDLSTENRRMLELKLILIVGPQNRGLSALPPGKGLPGGVMYWMLAKL